jgi:hypothetical protein
MLIISIKRHFHLLRFTRILCFTFLLRLWLFFDFSLRFNGAQKLDESVILLLSFFNKLVDQLFAILCPFP